MSVKIDSDKKLEIKKNYSLKKKKRKGIMKCLNSKQGYTLIELLTVLALISILTGVTVFTYKKTDITQTKKSLLRLARMFETKAASCVSSSGWQIDRKKADGTTETILPCNTKEKIGFDCKSPQCPALVVNDNALCLSIQKEISGNKYQIITRLTKTNPSFKPQFICGEVSSFLDITDPRFCKKSFKFGKDTNNNDIAIDGKKTLHGLMATDKDCKW